MILSVKNIKITLFLVFIFALSLRIGFIVFYDNGKMLKNEHYASDEYSYDQIAVNFLNGKGFVTDDGLYARRPPSYPLFLALIYFIFGYSLVTVRFIQVIIGALTCLIIYLISKEIFDKKTGLISAFICAIYYPFIQQPAYLLTEVLFTFILSLTVYFIFRAKRLNYTFTALLLAGVFLGISILCRDSLIAFPLIVLIMFLLDRHLKFKNKILKAVLIIFFTALIILPYTIRNYRIYHAFVPITVGGGHTLYLGNNALTTGGTGGEWILGQDSFLPSDIQDLFSLKTDKILKNRALKFIRENPKRFLWLSYKKFLNMWRPFYTKTRFISKIVMIFSYVPIMILGLVGMVLSLSFWRKTILLHALIFYFSAIHMITISEIRYRFPIMPYFIIFSAYTLTRLLRKSHA